MTSLSSAISAVKDLRPPVLIVKSIKVESISDAFLGVDDVEFVNSFSTFAVVVLLAESFIVEDFSSKTEVEEVTAFLSAVVAAAVGCPYSCSAAAAITAAAAAVGCLAAPSAAACTSCIRISLRNLITNIVGHCSKFVLKWHCSFKL